VEPAIFLLDEPLSNVDAAFRAVMRSELKGLQRRFSQTMVYVTHDQLEAMTMADRIAVMDHGRLLQVGTPLEVYNNPSDTFVARFIGSPGMNLIPARVDGDTAHMDGIGALTLTAAPGTAQVLAGFRPEVVHPDDDGPLAMGVEIVEHIGARTIVHLRAGETEVKAVLDAEHTAPREGQAFRFRVDAADIRLFDPATGAAMKRHG